MSDQTQFPEDPRSASVRGSPPAHTKFPPGRSGNPSGRPKGQRNYRTVIQKTVNQLITVGEGRRKKKITKFEAMVITMMHAGIKGDAKAQAGVIALMRSVNLLGDAPETSARQPLTNNDQALIAEYFERHGIRQRQADVSSDAPPTAPSIKAGRQ